MLPVLSNKTYNTGISPQAVFYTLIIKNLIPRKRLLCFVEIIPGGAKKMQLKTRRLFFNLQMPLLFESEFKKQ
jgi:hypothetical protein